MSPGVSNHTRRLSLRSYITTAPSSTQLKSVLFVVGYVPPIKTICDINMQNGLLFGSRLYLFTSKLQK